MVLWDSQLSKAKVKGGRCHSLAACDQVSHRISSSQCYKLSRQAYMVGIFVCSNANGYVLITPISNRLLCCFCGAVLDYLFPVRFTHRLDLLFSLTHIEPLGTHTKMLLLGIFVASMWKQAAHTFILLSCTSRITLRQTATPCR
jgi:hypothetical protein